MKLTPKQRSELHMKFGGRCAYCGCELPEKGWHADHVEPIYRGVTQHRYVNEEKKIVTVNVEQRREKLDVLENMVPACKPCNLFKSVWSVEQFREQIALQAQRAMNYSVNARTAERFGQIKLTPSPVVFWFEQYQEAEDAA
ncbi:HNH endonuclease [Pantoea sp. Al-1710]|uniref:HNH endonuclease n=1 Tax=Candidatus Pantoea communis TaxID=2608354 RepID=A0ABX0RT39_9GAMM|nr:HNH endonuclease signature motif containing protein [Pantoea communis]NIG20562.1 HNH endonuclease [Pantoea communis]